MGVKRFVRDLAADISGDNYPITVNVDTARARKDVANKARWAQEERERQLEADAGPDPAPRGGSTVVNSPRTVHPTIKAGRSSLGPRGRR